MDRALLIKNKLEKKLFKSKILFLCSDKFSNGNSESYLNKLKIKSYKLLPAIETFNYKNFVSSTQFILNFIEDERKKNNQYKILIISDVYKGVYSSAFRNIKYILDCKLIYLQHGENSFSNYSFSYKDGWLNEKNLSLIKKISIFFNQLKGSLKLKILDSLFFFKIAIKFSISLKKTFLVIFFKNLSEKLGFLNYGDLVLVSNNSAKNYLVKNSISKNIIKVIGSFIKEKHISLKHKKNKHNKFFNEIIFFSTGTHRSISSDNLENDPQHYFYKKLIEISKRHKKNIYFKLKAGEHLNFKKYFPNVNYIINIDETERIIEESTNPLFFLPADSTLTLEFSVQKVPYVIYSMWKNKSKIFQSNSNSNVETFNNALTIDKQLEDIFNGKFVLNFINNFNLNTLLGESKYLPTKNICENIVSLFNEK